MVEAAAIPETFFTVWTNLFDRGGLKAGETVLIHGGTSGIGTTAIQLAHAWGARVFATAGSPDKARACERLGAARGIDYHAEDFVEIVRKETDGKGVNVILDMVGAAYLARNLDAAAMEGRLVVISLIGGARGEINLNTVMSKRLTLTGSTLRIRSVAQKAIVAEGVQAQRVAAHRRGTGETGHSRDFPARAGERGPPLDGELEAHRQDRADGLAPRLAATTAPARSAAADLRTGRPPGPVRRCRSCRPRAPSAIPAWS